ncbi:hypothetical protein HG1285_11577 [Hydrogenivirga sp. 128-5-R1-1]|nr:hypothetical protein HG1285_11577 [Hydrogenivirga sp. 128-5-R1-1]
MNKRDIGAKNEKLAQKFLNLKGMKSSRQIFTVSLER